MRLGGRREKATGDGGCSRTTTSLCRAGATGVRAWTQEVGGALMSAEKRLQGPGLKQGQTAGWYNDPRVLRLGDSSGAGRTGPVLDIC